MTNTTLGPYVKLGSEYVSRLGVPYRVSVEFLSRVEYEDRDLLLIILKVESSHFRYCLRTNLNRLHRITMCRVSSTVGCSLSIFAFERSSVVSVNRSVFVLFWGSTIARSTTPELVDEYRGH